MSRTRDRVENIPDWRRHYIEKYGVDLVIALNRAMDEIGSNNEEVAKALECSVSHVESIRANGTSSLKEIAKIESESGMKVLSISINE